MNKNSKIFQALANKIRYNVSFSYIYALFLFVKCNLTVYLISIPYSVFLSRLSLFCSSTKGIPYNFSLLPIWFLLVQRLVSWMFPSFLAPRSSLLARLGILMFFNTVDLCIWLSGAKYLRRKFCSGLSWSQIVWICGRLGVRAGSGK